MCLNIDNWGRNLKVFWCFEGPRTFTFYILTPWQKERRISNEHQNDVVIDVTFKINAKTHDGV
jgi:hypothetical protein